MCIGIDFADSLEFKEESLPKAVNNMLSLALQIHDEYCRIPGLKVSSGHTLCKLDWNWNELKIYTCMNCSSQNSCKIHSKIPCTCFCNIYCCPFIMLLPFQTSFEQKNSFESLEICIWISFYLEQFLEKQELQKMLLLLFIF